MHKLVFPALPRHPKEKVCVMKFGMFSLAIMGRPNVGKSTLFNRLLGKKRAIVHDTPGVTRDWQAYDCLCQGHPLRLYDTPGLPDDVRHLPQLGVQALAWVVDGKSGMTRPDWDLARLLRKQDLPVILVVNKCESFGTRQAMMADVARLGCGDPVWVSALHGQGIWDLAQRIAEHRMAWHASGQGQNAAFYVQNQDSQGPRTPLLSVPDTTDHHVTLAEDLVRPLQPPRISDNHRHAEEKSHSESADDMPGHHAGNARDQGTDAQDGQLPTSTQDQGPLLVAVLGRPNVGKSTFVNRFLGYERMTTGPQAGITTDAVVTQARFRDRWIHIVDTAGLRKSSARKEDPVETLSGKETQRALIFCHVAIVMIDASQAVSKQDLAIVEQAEIEGRAIVLALHKWDQVPPEMHKDVVLDLPPSMRKYPAIPVSSVTGQGHAALWDQVLQVYQTWNVRLGTGPLNRWLMAMVRDNPPPMVRGHRIKVKYITQIKARPPTFHIYGSCTEELPASYMRYLANGLRQAFGFSTVKILGFNAHNPYQKDGQS